MTTLKQKFDYITQCYATIEEKNKLYYNAVKDWLQQHKIELLKQYKKDNSKNIAYRINHCNELLEKLQ